MALTHGLAFAAGVVVGWAGRAALGSTREAIVQTLVLSHGARDKVKRLVAEQAEWMEDMFAEGRARYDAQRGAVTLDTDVAPRVVEVKKRKRGHAA
jgi:hypothetical protein